MEFGAPFSQRTLRLFFEPGIDCNLAENWKLLGHPLQEPMGSCEFGEPQG